MTFTATPQPSNVPPRVLLSIDSDVTGSTFTELTVTRNGDPILQQPPTGAQTASTYDYLAPFGESVQYIADGEYLPFVVPSWTESWASLASWTGDTGSWSVAAGVASSTTANAAITRTTGGTVQRVNVTNPNYVRLEVLTAANVVVASVAVTTNAVLTGTSSASVSGTGSFELNLTAGTATATGTAGWTVTRPYTGVPTKVRFVSLGGSYSQTAEWTTTGKPDQIALASGGNIYVLDILNKLVRKFNSAGVAQTSWSTTGVPKDLCVDSAENIYVLDGTSKLVRKYTSTGTAGITWSTTGAPLGIGRDSSDNIYVLDGTSKLVRKYTSTGTAGITWSVDAASTALDVNPTAATIVVATDEDGDPSTAYRYNTSGTLLGSFGISNIRSFAVAVDNSGNIYISDYASGTTFVSKYTSAGTDAGSVALGFNIVGGVSVTSTGTLLIGDRTAKTVKSYAPTTASVGTVVATPSAASLSFREIVVTSIDIDEAWLLHPSSPSLSISIDANVWRDDGINVDISSAQTASAEASQTVHYPIGRARGVTISHGNRLDDKWTLVLFTPRLLDRDFVDAILRDQTPLLLRSPDAFGWDLPDGFYAVGDVDKTRVAPALPEPWRRISLPLTPSDPPVVRQGTERTYADLLTEAATYSDLVAMYDTYTDLLTGTPS